MINTQHEFIDPHSRIHRRTGLYFDNFRKHQESFRTHLLGVEDQPLPPSFLGPSSFWTSKEKDAFFHALSIHSRLRPDLIAENVGTKDVFDVCVYLDTLETAKKMQGLPPSEIRNSLPIAYDISDDWILKEEHASSHLIGVDACPWDLQSIGQPGNVCTCMAATSGKECYAQHMNSFNADILLHHLDPTCLVVAERMVREVYADHEDPVDMAYHDHSRQAVTATSTDADLPLDGAFAHGEPVASLPLDHTISSDARRRLRNRLYMRRKRAELAGGVANASRTKLRPGRSMMHKAAVPLRSKQRYQRQKEPIEDSGNAAKPANYEETELSDAGSDGGKIRGGLTKPYKIKHILENHNIDGNTFLNHNMDLLNLTALGRLTNLFIPLGGESATSSKEISISAHTIMALISFVLEFTRNVLHKIIVEKEQENRVKGAQKVWKRHIDEVTTENVKQTLSHMKGMSGSDHESETLNDTKRDILVRDERRQERVGDMSDFLGWCCSPLIAKNFDQTDELPSQINEAHLEAELSEEDMLDIEDIDVSRKHQTELWATDGS